MDNENFNYDTEQSEQFESQQFNQGGPPPPPPGFDQDRRRGGEPPFGFDPDRRRGGEPPSPPFGFDPDRRRGGEPPSPPPGFDQDGPRRGVRPPSAPPNFVPDAPRMGGQPYTGSPEYGAQFRTGDGQFRQRNYWGCLYRFTYIWLINGNNFWFYPTAISWQQLEGWRWRNGRWDYDRINLRRIFFFTCF